jgi:hypothetical protein
LTVQYQGTRDIPLSGLTRFPGNPRKGNVAAIRQSVQHLTQYRSIVVRDTGDGLVILAGNHTADAIEAEGMPAARCDVITCTDDEARRIVAADNRTSDLGSYDDELLAELLAQIADDDSGTGYEGTGWSDKDADAYANLTAPPDLDDLAGKLGEPEPEDMWPAMRVRAPHHVIAAWNEHVKTCNGDDAAALAKLLGVDLDTAA